MDESALQWLAGRSFAGNVRELRNLVRRAALLSDGPLLSAQTFERLERMSPRRAPVMSSSKDSQVVSLHVDKSIKEAREAWNQQLESSYLERLLDRFGEDVEGLAKHLNLHRKSVFRLYRHHGIDAPFLR